MVRRGRKGKAWRKRPEVDRIPESNEDREMEELFFFARAQGGDGGDGGDEDAGSATDGGECEEYDGQGMRQDPRERTRDGSGIGM